MALGLSRLTLRNPFRRGAPLPAPRPAASGLGWLADIGPSRIVTNRRSTSALQLDAYVGWCYAAVSVLAQDVHARPWGLWRGDEEVDARSVAPAVRVPRPGVTWADFAELTQIHLDLAGKAFWHVLAEGEGKSRKVRGVQLVPPSWVTGPEIDRGTGRHIGWKISVSGARPVVRSVEDMCLVRWPHPTDQYDGASPVQAFASSLDMDLYARAYTATTLEHNAQVPGILTTDQDLTPIQSEMLRERWLQRHGSGAGAMEGPAVLGRGTTYQQLSLSIRDLEFMSLANLSMEQIFGCYHVPPSKAGISQKGGTLEITREAANTYAEVALVPRLDRISDKANNWLLPRLGVEGIELRYESPIRKDVDSIHRRTSESLRNGTITVNEHRLANGLEEITGGDVYYMPAGVRVVSQIEPHDPFAPFDDPAPDPAPDDKPDDETKRAPAPAPSPVACALSAEALELSVLRFLRHQERHERTLKNASGRLFSREVKAIIAGIKDKYDKAAPLPIVRALGDEVVADVLADSREAWVKALYDTTLKSLRAGFDLLGEDGVPSQFLLDWDLYHPQAFEWAERNAAEKVVEIQATTQRALAPVIAEAIGEGEPVNDIAKLITETADKYKGLRAETIARTETANAVNHGKSDHALEAQKALGVRYRKTWNPVPGSDRTREAHRIENVGPSPTVLMEQVWSIGGERLRRPLDPRGSAANVINCRCTMTLEVIEEPEDSEDTE